MPGVLFAWVGNADLRAAAGDAETGLGPIACAATTRKFDEVVLLSTHDGAPTRSFVAWLRKRARVAVVIHSRKLAEPHEYREIHDAAVRAILEAQQRHGRDAEFTYHLSPGAP